MLRISVIAIEIEGLGSDVRETGRRCFCQNFANDPSYIPRIDEHTWLNGWVCGKVIDVISGLTTIPDQHVQLKVTVSAEEFKRLNAEQWRRTHNKHPARKR